MAGGSELFTAGAVKAVFGVVGTLFTAAFLGLFGFVFRVQSRLTGVERDVDDNRDVVARLDVAQKDGAADVERRMQERLDGVRVSMDAATASQAESMKALGESFKAQLDHVRERLNKMERELSKLEVMHAEIHGVSKAMARLEGYLQATQSGVDGAA